MKRPERIAPVPSRPGTTHPGRPPPPPAQSLSESVAWLNLQKKGTPTHPVCTSFIVQLTGKRPAENSGPAFGQSQTLGKDPPPAQRGWLRSPQQRHVLRP